MQVTQAVFLRLDHIHLRVRVLARSLSFYRDLLGLTEVPANPPSEMARIMEARTGSGEITLRIVVAEGLPSGSELIGVDHFSLAVGSEEDVEDLHRRSLDMGFIATQPRIYAGAYQTFLFDPDGYKVEVIAAGGRDTDGTESEE
jgi:catechol 2,3-dioxygenase-like lactoylglutathione lyase family enzyme